MADNTACSELNIVRETPHDTLSLEVGVRKLDSEKPAELRQTLVVERTAKVNEWAEVASQRKDFNAS